MKSEIKYKTAGDNTVVWKKDVSRAPSSDPFGSYECGGCGRTADGFASTASKHAEKCRAL